MAVHFLRRSTRMNAAIIAAATAAAAQATIFADPSSDESPVTTDGTTLSSGRTTGSEDTTNEYSEKWLVLKVSIPSEYVLSTASRYPAVFTWYTCTVDPAGSVNGMLTVTYPAKLVTSTPSLVTVARRCRCSR